MWYLENGAQEEISFGFNIFALIEKLVVPGDSDYTVWVMDSGYIINMGVIIDKKK